MNNNVTVSHFWPCACEHKPTSSYQYFYMQLLVAIFYVKTTAPQLIMIQSFHTKKYVAMDKHGHISAKVSTRQQRSDVCIRGVFVR